MLWFLDSACDDSATASTDVAVTITVSEDNFPTVFAPVLVPNNSVCEEAVAPVVSIPDSECSGECICSCSCPGARASFSFSTRFREEMTINVTASTKKNKRASSMYKTVIGVEFGEGVTTTISDS